MKRLFNALLILAFVVPTFPAAAEPEPKVAAFHAEKAPHIKEDIPTIGEYPPQIELVEQTEVDFRIGVVSAYSLNVRDNPNGNIVDGLELQDEVIILDQSGDWVQVDLGETTGWVHGDYLLEDSAPLTASEQTTVGDLSCPSNECWASVEFYYTPLPEHFVGNAAMYAPGIMEATAIHNGFDLDGFAGGVAVSSAADLGQVVWLRKDSDWIGPYLVVDVSSRGHIWNHLVVKGQSVEIPFELAKEWGMAWGDWQDWGINHGGMPDVEVYKGLLPPESGEPIVLRDWFLENGELDDSPSLSENRLWTIAMAEYQNFNDYLLDLSP